MVIGIVGKSGAGKTLAGRFFEKNGFLHIDGDKVAREVVEKGKPALSELVSEFGSTILLQSGELDRKKLASIVFSDSEKLKMLNEITHKYILAQFDKLISETNMPVVIDAAALIESGYTKRCTAVIFIKSNIGLRTDRVTMRDNISAAEIKTRLSAQKEDSFYEAAADYTVENNGSPHELEEKLAAILSKIMAG